MEAKSKWLTEDGNIVAPNTMDSCIFGSDGKSLKEKIPFKFGIDENGNYGYIKAGADAIIPFGTGDGGGSGLGDCELIWSGTTELDTSSHDLTLNKSIDNYDYLLVSYWNLANSNGGSHSNNILIPKSDFYLTASISGVENDTFSVGENLSGGSVIYLTFRFIDNKTLTYRNGTTSDGYRTAIRAIYGIKKAGLHNYSTEEKVVGTWIDGKPLYEKTVLYDGVIAQNTKIYQDDSIGEFIDVFNKYFYDTNFSHWCGSINGDYELNITSAGKSLNGNVDSAYVSRITKCRCTIQYTKTTDTATV